MLFRITYREPDGITGTFEIEADDLADARRKAARSNDLPPGASVVGAPTTITPQVETANQDGQGDPPEPEPKTYNGKVLPAFFQNPAQYAEFLTQPDARKQMVVDNNLQNFAELNDYILAQGQLGVTGEQGEQGGVPSFAEYIQEQIQLGNVDPNKVTFNADGTVTTQPNYFINKTGLGTFDTDTGTGTGGLTQAEIEAIVASQTMDRTSPGLSERERERFLEGVTDFGAFAEGLRGTPLEGLREAGGFGRRFAEQQYAPAEAAYRASQILPLITGGGLTQGAAERLATNDETLNAALRKRISGKTLSDIEAALLSEYDSVSNQPQTFSAFTRRFLGQGPEASRTDLLNQFREAAALDEAATGIGREFARPSSQANAAQIENFARSAFASQYSPIIQQALAAALPQNAFADYARESLAPAPGGGTAEQPNFLQFIGSRYGLI